MPMPWLLSNVYFLREVLALKLGTIFMCLVNAPNNTHDLLRKYRKRLKESSVYALQCLSK